MIYIINIIVAFLFSLVSLSVLPNLHLMGFVPLVPLFFIISLAYFRKGFEPILAAAFVGIYFDLYSSLPFGFYLFFFLLSAAVVRYMFQEGMKQLSLLPYFSVCLSATTIFYLFQIGFLYRMGAKIGTSLFLPVLLGLAINGVCVILLYAFSGWYFEKISALEEKLKRR